MPTDLDNKVHSAFSPAPLTPEETDTLYEDLDGVRGGYHCASQLREIILREGDHPSCQLLAGHVGSGKSTALAKLRRQLDQAGDAYVFAFNAEQALGRDDLDAPNLLLALSNALRAHLHKQEGIWLGSRPLDRFKKRCQRTFNAEIRIRGAKAKAPFGEANVTIEQHADYRRIVRNHVGAEPGTLTEAINELLRDAAARLAAKNKPRRLVLTIDGLDKMSNAAAPNVEPPAERLFIGRAMELTALQCHVVYTIPLDLAYSTLSLPLSERYHRDPWVIPMVTVAPRPPATTVDKRAAAGRQALRGLVHRRLDRAGVAEGDVFADGALDMLIKFTGGNPSGLMTWIQEAAASSPLPIGKDVIDAAVTAYRTRHHRRLTAEHTPLLLEALSRGQVTRTTDNECAWRELVTSGSLLIYLDDREWYGVNPVIDTGSLPGAPLALAEAT